MAVDFALMGRQFADLRPAGGARVNVWDFPWKFDHWSELGQKKSAEHHYKTMTDEEIAQIPIDAIAADNSVHFIWVTWPKMMVWPKIIEALGLTYAGLAWEWIKFNPKTGKYAFSGGYGTRKNLEPCLLCTKGTPQLRQPIISDMLGEGVIPEGVHSVRDFIEAMPMDAIRAPRRQHSRKPDEQYERIETMFEGPYFEGFSRCDRPGWISWGDQAGLFNAEPSAAIERASDGAPQRASGRQPELTTAV